MSETMFGIPHGKATKAEARRRDRICRREGGHGWQQIDQSYGTRGGQWIGWYTGPNRGEPYDRDLAQRVLAAVGGDR